MINTRLKKKIIATLGNHYCKKVIPFLTANGVLNQKGEPYKNSSIHNIVNGDRENIEVENKILNLVQITEKQLSRNKSLKSKILKKK